MARILVTGGAGYIGSHTVKLLIAKGHHVVVLDNLSYGHRDAVPPGLLVVGDLRDVDHVDQLLVAHRIDAVIHFAAFAYVGESVMDPAKYYLNNLANSGSSDRALGGTPSAYNAGSTEIFSSQSVNVVLRIKNSTGSALTGMRVAYDTVATSTGSRRTLAAWALSSTMFRGRSGSSNPSIGVRFSAMRASLRVSQPFWMPLW